VNDGAEDSAPATVSITVNPVNDAPVAVADAYSVEQNTTLTVDAPGGVLGNDTDVDGDTLTAGLDAGPANGILSIFNDNGSFEYTPSAGFTGEDSFTYTATDGNGGSSTTTVTITVDSTQNSVFVQEITMALVSAGKNTKAEATVLVHDGGGAVAGATVHGDWYYNGSLTQSDVSGIGDANGYTILVSTPEKAKSGDTFQFVVTNVVLTGSEYDPANNQASDGSITVP
jgi:hypothetical protein